MIREEIIDQYWVQFIDWASNGHEAFRTKGFETADSWVTDVQTEVSRPRHKVEVEMVTVAINDSNFWRWYAQNIRPLTNEDTAPEALPPQPQPSPAEEGKL